MWSTQNADWFNSRRLGVRRHRQPAIQDSASSIVVWDFADMDKDFTAEKFAAVYHGRTMQCPVCSSHRIRRSRRLGLTEGFFLRLILRAPYRCGDCDVRFWNDSRNPLFRRQMKHHTIFGYFGLRGAEKKRIKHSIFIIIIVSILAVASIYLGLFMADRALYQSSHSESSPE